MHGAERTARWRSATRLKAQILRYHFVEHWRVPETVEGFLRNAERGARALRVRGTALLIECAAADVAARLAADERTASLCLRAGERHLVVRTKFEEAFRKTVRKLGYGMTHA